MNRLWVRLWLGIMGALVGLAISLEVAVTLAEAVFRGLGENEIALIVVSNVLGVLLSALFAALTAWRLAQPLSTVSQAARLFAEGDLSARARLLPGRWRNERRFGGEATRLVDDFNAMAASLERLEAGRQATAAVIAHELRTPLAMLQARPAALRDGVFAFDAREVQRLVQQTDLLARLVEDLRTLSLAKAGKLTLHPHTCNLSALVNDVVESFRPHAAAKGIRLMVCGARSDPAGRRGPLAPGRGESSRQRVPLYTCGGYRHVHVATGPHGRDPARPGHRPMVRGG